MDIPKLCFGKYANLLSISLCISISVSYLVSIWKITSIENIYLFIYICLLYLLWGKVFEWLGTRYKDQTNIKLGILMPLPLESWDYKSGPPYPGWKTFNGNCKMHFAESSSEAPCVFTGHLLSFFYELAISIFNTFFLFVSICLDLRAFLI